MPGKRYIIEYKSTGEALYMQGVDMLMSKSLPEKLLPIEGKAC